VHIADAPCHGQEFNSGLSDSFPEGDKLGRSASVLLHKLRVDCHVSTYFFCHLNAYTQQMVNEFKRLTSGMELQNGGEWIQDEAFLNIHNIVFKLEILSKTTIQRSMSTVGRGGAEPKFVPEVVISRVPNWAYTEYIHGAGCQVRVSKLASL
jgi:hypothetical protein